MKRYKALTITSLIWLMCGCSGGAFRRVNATEFEGALNNTNSASWGVLIGASQDRAYLELRRPTPGFLEEIFVGPERQVWWIPLEELSSDRLELLRNGLIKTP